MLLPLIAATAGALATAALGPIHWAQQAADTYTPPVAIAEAPSPRAMFPRSAWTAYYPPRPVTLQDADYLAWVSGADGEDAAVVRRWAAALAESAPAWIDDAFGPIRVAAAEYAHDYAGAPSTDERARALESIMRRREKLARSVFERERDRLVSMFESRDGIEYRADALVERVMLARISDSVDIGAIGSGHLVPNILKLLHATASDPRTSPEGSSAIRRLAIDNALRVAGQRCHAVDLCLNAGHRGHAARAQAAARGAPVAAAAASVFRPIAVAGARAAALNRELLTLVEASIPPEVAAEAERALRCLVYGPLGDDLFAYDAVVRSVDASLSPEARATANGLIAIDRHYRAELHERSLRLFDQAIQHHLEQGLVTRAADSQRFVRSLVDYHKSAYGSAERTLLAMGDLARASPAFDEPGFTHAVGAWRALVQERLDGLMNSGAMSRVATSEMFRDAGEIALIRDAPVTRR